MMNFEDMVKRISGETGVDEKEILEKIKEKQKELGSLITPEGAAHIVANELGINLFEGFSKAPELKIENIIPGMLNVDVVGRVLRIFPPKEFQRENNTKSKVCSLILGDGTSTIRTVFWGKSVEMIEKGEIEEGDVLRIKRGYTKENLNGEAELHIGNRTRIIVNPKDVDKENFPSPWENRKKISELEDGMPSVDVVCKVLRIYEPREFEREDKSKGRVVNILVGDETGKARVVLWDEDVNLIDRIKEGDIIKVRKGYVKLRFDEPEINVGKYGKVILNPEEKVEVKDIEKKIERKEIKDLKQGETAEIRAAIVEVYENFKVFDRENGRKGVVINAIVDDGTGNIRAAFYDKMAEVLLNIPLEKLLNEDVSKEIEERKKEILGREVIILANVKYSEFSGREELVVNDINLNPDPKEEVRMLLRKIKG